MDILHFQKALMAEVENILKDIITINPDGERHIGVNVYKQFLPKVVNDDEDVSQFFPYAIVRVDESNTPDDFTPWLTTVDILFGVYDADEYMGGHDHITIMIQRVVNRFSQEALLDKKYRCESAMDWAIQDEDTFPYFFGLVQLKFNLPKIGRSEPIYGRQKTGGYGYEGYC